jgi:diketogulonate reductase-like aldo/keto reductase
MLVKELGRTGVSIPEVGIGTFAYQGGPELLRQGLDAGALFIDTAESYGTESVVGEALRGIRDRVFLATKVSPEHFHERDLRDAVDASLRRLAVDSVDLVQLHYPNPSIPIQETMGALSGLVDAGKVRFCGVSNFSIDQLREAQKALGARPLVSNQVRYNIIDRTIESGLLHYCQQHGITVIVYSPLAKSLNRIIECDPSGSVSQIARAVGKSPAQVVINWCLCKDGVVAIPKAGSREHLLDNCGASDWRLSSEQIALLDARIQFRHRNRFDQLARKLVPRGLQRFAVGALRYLPHGVRRRVL